jgi:O-acetyl-ADP-ribose deacetylase (regulator of RNase III)
MLTYVKGNLFDSPAKVLVNTVNTVGVMGKGIAKTFKDIYPEMFKRYLQLCETKQFDIGNLWLYKTEHKWVLNFPTKKHWRNPSTLEFIEAGLRKFADSYSRENITSVAFPQLGCGNGELKWEEVEPMMVRYLRPLPISVYIYLYGSDPNTRVEHRDIESMRHWLRSEPRTLAFDEFWTDVKAQVGSSGSRFTKWNNGEQYSAQVVTYDQEGLLLHFGDRSRFEVLRDSARNVINSVLQTWRFASKRAIFVPAESLVELWQSVRFYGFCYSKTLPPGLEVLSDYLLPIFRPLPYFKATRLSGLPGGPLENGLQLFIPETASSRINKSAEAVLA